MDDSLHEPFVLYGYLAAVAPALELVTAIVTAPQRQTALLAKQAVQLDLRRVTPPGRLQSIAVCAG